MADGTAQQLSFEVEVVVVDTDGQAIEGLTASNFALRACTPRVRRIAAQLRGAALAGAASGRGSA